MTVSRPLLRWHGGKWRLAPWILRHFPQHRIYVEPFGGAASVLLRKPPSHAEVYNDLDDEVVNLFRVLRSAGAARLRELLRLTPFARAEFAGAYEATDEPVERARRLVVRSYMGFGSDGHNLRVRTGFRSNSNRSGTTPARDWANYPDALGGLIERLRDVIVESRPAVQVMRSHDGADTLHYADPPYMPDTRSKKRRRSGEMYHGYAHEMSVEDHAALLDALVDLDGMVVLSGYPNELYESRLAGWQRIQCAALADGAHKRVEVLWLNPAASDRLAAGPLFEIAA